MPEPADQQISLEGRTKDCKPLVLIIDKKPQFARFFDFLAEKLGITAHIVNSCGAAISALDKFSFDVVLIKWHMPEIDGATCTRTIRCIEENNGKHSPIIGVTGHLKVNRENCLAAGMDVSLQCPLPMNSSIQSSVIGCKQKQNDSLSATIRLNANR